MDTIIILLGSVVIACMLARLMVRGSDKLAGFKNVVKAQTFLAQSEDCSHRVVMFYVHSDRGRFARMQKAVAEHPIPLN